MNSENYQAEDLADYQIDDIEEEFSQLKVGDIIWAKRYASEEKYQRIQEGHREGPFIIIAKDNFNTYGLSCTSNSHPECQGPYHYYKACFRNNNLNKVSYIYTTKVNKIIPYQYQYIIGRLNDQELNKLFKVLYIVNHGHQDFINKVLPNISYTIEEGDIISTRPTRYYVYDKDSTNYYCYPINQAPKTKAHLVIRNQFWMVDFSKSTAIPINDPKIRLIDTIEYYQIKNIATIKQQYDEAKAKENTICRGKLVTTTEGLYYIYAEYKDNWICFKAYQDDTSHQYLIIIGEKKYYTDYEEQIISKKTPMIITSIGSPKEIETIKAQRDDIHLQVKKQQRKKHRSFNQEPRLTPRVIIINKDTLVQYLITARRQGNVTILDLSTNELKECSLNKIARDPFKFYCKLNEIEFQSYLINKPKIKTLKRV